MKKLKSIEPKIKIKIIDYALIVVIALLLIAVFIMYNGKLTGKVVSDGGYSNLSVRFEMNNSANSDFLAFKSIEPLGRYVVINYTFDNSGFIGNWVSIDVWIVNEMGNEIKRAQDIFSIKKDGLIEREIWFDLGNENTGVYYVYLALTEDLKDPIKQSIIIGKTSLVGNTILDQPGNKMIGYVVFLLIILVGVFFIVRMSYNQKEFKGLEE